MGAELNFLLSFSSSNLSSLIPDVFSFLAFVLRSSWVLFIAGKCQSKGELSLTVMCVRGLDLIG
jgi:hypothetical protein